jgi:phenylacetate-coenzyme A ligase PaaK-like adenylate-forming protein
LTKLIKTKELIYPFTFEKNFFFKFEKKINFLTNYHYKRSNIYRKLLEGMGYNPKRKYKIEDLPFVSSNLFKEFEIKSIKNKNIYKILISSGTSGNKLSKIFLNRENAQTQRIALTKIFHHYIGKERYPMLIIGQKFNNNNLQFDAKTAAIRGFSLFGKNHTFLLDDNGKLNIEEIRSFMKKFEDKKILIFGFTSDAYEFFFTFYKELLSKISFHNATLLHGGGWKKLDDKKITNSIFKKKFLEVYKIKKVINYYGMIEQVGSIFFECPTCQVFQCSNFSNILIRDKNFNILEKGKGYAQLISLLPTSYPGHNLLTEDIAKLSKCRCGFKGKSFKIIGRIKNSDIRGCSNV